MRTYIPKRMFADKSGKKGVPTRVFGSKKNNVIGFTLLAVLAGAGFAFGGDLKDWTINKFTGGKASSLADVGLTDEEQMAKNQQEININIPDQRAGVASTVYFNAYDTEANSETSVSPTCVVYDKSGNKIINGATCNSTSTTKPNELTVYMIGSTYYQAMGKKVDMMPAKFEITSEGPTYSLDAATIASETSLTVVAYDSDMNTLTADDNASNTADYSYSLGADQEKLVWIKLTNGDSNSMYQMGAACVFASMNSTGTDDFELLEFKFGSDVYSAESLDVPKQLDKASLSIANDAATAFTQTGYDRCYKPKGMDAIKLHEWDEVYVKGKITAGSTDPAANGGNNVGLLFIDAAYEDGKDGKVYFDIYKHDDDEQVTAVGLSDTTTSPQGLTSGVVIELQ